MKKNYTCPVVEVVEFEEAVMTASSLATDKSAQKRFKQAITSGKAIVIEW